MRHPLVLMTDAEADIKGYTHEGIHVLPLSEALQRYPGLLEHYLFRSFPADDWYGGYHAALCENIITVYAPSDVKAITPLSLSFNASSGFTHVLVIAEPGSVLTLIDTPQSDRLRLYSRATELIVKEGAEVTYVAAHHYADELKTFSLAVASVEKDGHLHWMDHYQGGQFTFSRSMTFLQHPGASLSLQQVLIGQGTQQLDLQSAVNHRAPHTKSMMVSKGVLLDQAKAVTRGLINMQRGASQSEGYQQQDMLLLSEEAEVDPLPVLEINQDDVKCKHGATVSQINDDHLYYLMSRGLDRETAKRELIEGFVGEIVDGTPDERLQKEIRANIASCLKERSL